MNAYHNASPLYITEEHLGNPEDFATRAAAERLCVLLQARGWDVRYGQSLTLAMPDGHEAAFEADWNASLDELSAELFGPPESLTPVLAGIGVTGPELLAAIAAWTPRQRYLLAVLIALLRDMPNPRASGELANEERYMLTIARALTAELYGPTSGTK